MKSKFLLPILVFMLVACNQPSLDSASQFVTDNFTAPKDSLVQVTPHAVYVIIDGSGSGQAKYAVPKLTLADVENLVNKISLNGGGQLYLNSIDIEANNNRVSQCHIAALPNKPTLRERLAGEQKYQYDRIKKEFNSQMEAYQKEYQKTTGTVELLKRTYKNQWVEFLEQAYKPKGKEEDYSDIIGVINTANRSLNANTSNVKKSIVALSDLENDVPKDAKAENPRPDGIKVYRVNASDSGNSSIANTIESDSFENSLTKIFNNN
jgi:hypothetical protein